MRVLMGVVVCVRALVLVLVLMLVFMSVGMLVLVLAGRAVRPVLMGMPLQFFIVLFIVSVLAVRVFFVHLGHFLLAVQICVQCSSFSLLAISIPKR